MFCKHCGNQINENMRFCAACGAMVTGEPQKAAPAFVPAPPYAGQKRQKGGMNWLITLIATILIVMGIGHITLTVVGKTVTAQVTGHEQVLIVNNDTSTRNPSRYKLEYEFSVKNKRYTGSVTRIFQGGSHMRQTLPVRYLSFWPHVNSEDSGRTAAAGPFMLIAGFAVLKFNGKKRRNQIPPFR